MSLALVPAVPSDTSLEQRDRDQRFIRALDTLLSHSGATHTASDLVELSGGPGGSYRGVRSSGCCAPACQATPLTSSLAP
jgi:hypothetical protein